MAKQAQKNCAPMRFDIEITLERDLFIIGTPQDELSGFLRKSMAPIHLSKLIDYAYINIWIDFEVTFDVNCNANLKVNFDVNFRLFFWSIFLDYLGFDRKSPCPRKHSWFMHGFWRMTKPITITT